MFICINICIFAVVCVRACNHVFFHKHRDFLGGSETLNGDEGLEAGNHIIPSLLLNFLTLAQSLSFKMLMNKNCSKAFKKLPYPPLEMQSAFLACWKSRISALDLYLTKFCILMAAFESPLVIHATAPTTESISALSLSVAPVFEEIRVILLSGNEMWLWSNCNLPHTHPHQYTQFSLGNQVRRSFWFSCKSHGLIIYSICPSTERIKRTCGYWRSFSILFTFFKYSLSFLRHLFLLSQHDVFIIGYLHNVNKYLCDVSMLPDPWELCWFRCHHQGKRFILCSPTTNEHTLKPTSSQACVCRE